MNDPVMLEIFLETTDGKKISVVKVSIDSPISDECRRQIIASIDEDAKSWDRSRYVINDGNMLIGEMRTAEIPFTQKI